METILIFKEKNRQEKVVRQTEREREREHRQKAGEGAEVLIFSSRAWTE
jgi:hypothetical protein